MKFSSQAVLFSIGVLQQQRDLITKKHGHEAKGEAMVTKNAGRTHHQQSLAQQQQHGPFRRSKEKWRKSKLPPESEKRRKKDFLGNEEEEEKEEGSATRELNDKGPSMVRMTNKLVNTQPTRTNNQDENRLTALDDDESTTADKDDFLGILSAGGVATYGYYYDSQSGSSEGGQRSSQSQRNLANLNIPVRNSSFSISNDRNYTDIGYTQYVINYLCESNYCSCLFYPTPYGPIIASVDCSLKDYCTQYVSKCGQPSWECFDFEQDWNFVPITETAVVSKYYSDFVRTACIFYHQLSLSSNSSSSSSSEGDDEEDGPQCGIQQNPEFCTNKLLDSVPVTCECYAFCGDTFVECQSIQGGLLRTDQCASTPITGCNRAISRDSVPRNMTFCFEGVIENDIVLSCKGSWNGVECRSCKARPYDNYCGFLYSSGEALTERCERLWNGTESARWCYEIDCTNTEIEKIFDTCYFGPWDGPMWYEVHQTAGCADPCVVYEDYYNACTNLYESVDLETYKVNGSMNCIGLMEMAARGYFSIDECTKIKSYVPEKCGCPIRDSSPNGTSSPSSLAPSSPVVAVDEIDDTNMTNEATTTPSSSNAGLPIYYYHGWWTGGLVKICLALAAAGAVGTAFG